MSGDLAGIGTTLEYILLNALCSSLQFCTGSPSCKNNLPSLLLALTRVAGKYLQTNLYFVYTNCCHCISQETVHISQQLCTKQQLQTNEQFICSHFLCFLLQLCAVLCFFWYALFVQVLISSTGCNVCTKETS